MPIPPCEPVFQVIESGRDGENLEKLSIETTVLNVHYVIHIIGFHVILMRPNYPKVNLGHPPLALGPYIHKNASHDHHLLVFAVVHMQLINSSQNLNLNTSLFVSKCPS